MRSLPILSLGLAILFSSGAVGEEKEADADSTSGATGREARYQKIAINAVGRRIVQVDHAALAEPRFLAVGVDDG